MIGFGASAIHGVGDDYVVELSGQGRQQVNFAAGKLMALSQIPSAAVMRRTARVSCFAILLQSEGRRRCSSRSETSPGLRAEPRKRLD
ncbi:hypothetical protein GFL84_28115 [Rhizobium leguminosarum bv. viciae]|nr:hypothetical protein [Rhizobium leguminosarum bv. viciae]NKM09414.1 hypothetical protein [Rhizobium leguminosarum bv. viciae]NKM65521.1 hypothetical protein [Rhizobium leguminosarum bv. viciae]NKM81100.1 hypothetical protein [Rhizobium leguminosarum bv. viciae]